jgi:putative ABC transport system ATP-binding protein
VNARRSGPAPGAPALRLLHVSKSFGGQGAQVTALDDVSLEVPAGQRVAVVGVSGSGKSTLLHLVAGLETPSAGEVCVDGQPLAGLGDDALTRLRRDRIGIVFQFFHLLPTLSVRENVALPGLLGGGARHEWLARADRLIDEVGLAARRDARPHTLSGGELQRAAVARALVHEPALLLADEPTGNLDSRSAGTVLAQLDALVRARGTTLLLVTHSRAAAALADRTIDLRDGRIVADTGAGSAASAGDPPPAGPDRAAPRGGSAAP